ncbi:DUF6221 family protein [Streptomyces sp. NPDC007063]|uniref:DUF6221 family protein n=1 Tax=Streptomyces sp. NPDC007063 TaxID=3364772 RepID=UPI0036D1E467
MSDLVAFLRARLDEDETMARKAASRQPRSAAWTHEPDGKVRAGDGTPVAKHAWADEGAHITRHDPARVLAEVDARRRILRWHLDEECCSVCLDDVEGCPLFRALALPYADHPDYREEWRP